MSLIEAALPFFVLSAIVQRKINLTVYLDFPHYGLSILERNKIAGFALGFFCPQGVSV
jgi:hypothetical protein